MINAFKVKKIKSHVLKNWVKISEKKKNRRGCVLKLERYCFRLLPLFKERLLKTNIFVTYRISNL